MAIYKNREVQIIGPNIQANSPESINISYKDGTKENVLIDQVYFSTEEKTSLVKKYPSKYDNLNVASAKDIENVQHGSIPTFDPSYIEPTVKSEVKESK